MYIHFVYILLELYYDSSLRIYYRIRWKMIYRRDILYVIDHFRIYKSRSQREKYTGRK